MIFFRYFVVIFPLLFFSSCQDENIYLEENKNIPNAAWSYKDTVAFSFDVIDTNQRFDFLMNLRITRSYEWSNFFVFMVLEGPQMIAMDTVDIPLADLAGSWKGKVSGSLVENNVMFMKNVRFPKLGKHKISFIQGMRDLELGEVSDVGLTIIKSK